MLRRSQALTDFLNDPSTPRRVKRDAIRTLRGHVLRSEVYALDGSDQADRPYSVTESLYDLRAEETIEGVDILYPRRCFFPYAQAERVTQWERGDESYDAAHFF